MSRELPREVVELLAVQDGVVARAQLLRAKVTQARMDTMLRRRELVALHPGVYLTHTGTPTWRQRAWAAVLYAGRGALHLEHALHQAGEGRTPEGPVDVAVDWSRRVRPQPGLRIHRVRGLESKVRWNASPPRVRVEVATLELAHRAVDDLAAISILTAAVGSRRTTAARLAEALATRRAIFRRALLEELVADLATGTHSVLEHGYLMRVLRPHLLPEPSAQQVPRAGARGQEYRDAEHAGLELTVELDGRTHDSSAARDDDAERDLADLASGQVVPRLRYRQVFGSPCRTALQLSRLFRLRGWEGTAAPCGSPDCALRPPALLAG